LVLAAGEVPSEPGGVAARSIPLTREMARKTMWEHFVAVASNGSRCDSAVRDDGQSVPGGKEASVAVARRFQSFKVGRQPWPLFVKP